MKSTKLVLIILSLALLVGSIVGISVAAETTTPTLDIYSKNLSYGSNISILFAVKSENLDGAEIKLNVYESDPTAAATTPAATVTASYQDTVHDTLCDIFFTPGINAKSIHRQIYVQAVATVGDNTYYSEVERYSVLEYCHEMIARDDTDATKDAKYQAVIDYGAAIQSLLSEDTDSEGNPKFEGALATEYKYVTIVGGTLDGKYSAGVYLPDTKLNPAIAGATKLDGTFTNGSVTTVVSGAEYTVTDSVAFAVAVAPANPHTFEGITEIPAGLTVVPLAEAPTVVNQSGTLPSMSPVIRSSGISGNSTGILFWNGLDGDSTVLKIDETADDKADANAVEFSCDMLINYQSTNNEEREFVNIVFTKADGTVAYNLILRNTSKSTVNTNIGVVTRNSAGTASGNGTFVQNADNVWFNLRAVYTTTDTGIEVTLYANGNEFAQKHSVPYTEGNIVSADDISNVYIYANTHSDSTVNIHYQFALDNINLQHVKVD